MKRPQIPIIECPKCQGRGGAPDVGTGAIMRQERKDAEVTVKDLLDHFTYSKTYTVDLEADKRPWNWELIDQYRAALQAVVDDRIKERAA